MKPKTLTWNVKPFTFSDQGLEGARSFLRYHVGQFSSDHPFYANKWTADLCAIPLKSAPNGSPELFDTEEEAKAACQVDFNERAWSLFDK